MLQVASCKNGGCLRDNWAGFLLLSGTDVSSCYQLNHTVDSMLTFANKTKNEKKKFETFEDPFRRLNAAASKSRFLSKSIT